MTTMTASNWKPSEAQIKLMRDVFAERVANDVPNRQQWWDNIKGVSTLASFQSVLADLKARPKTVVSTYVAPVYTAPVLPTVATEAGLYRNPVDGTLYRLSISTPKKSWERPVKSISVYSNKAVYRRLTEEGRMVKKGKWTRLGAYDRDSMLGFSYSEKIGRTPLKSKLLAEWLMADEEKLEWAIGICMCCMSPLIDAVSVYNGIGPVCAKNWGVPLRIPPV